MDYTEESGKDMGCILIVLQDNSSFSDSATGINFTFQEKGIYFMKMAASDGSVAMYPTSLEINGYTFGGSGYKIKEEYLSILEKGESSGSETLTWDGNTDGLVPVMSSEIEPGAIMSIYKISDDAPTVEQASAGGKIYTFSDGTMHEYNFTAEDIIPLNDSLSAYACIEAFIVALEDNVEADGLVLPEKGFYTTLMTIGDVKVYPTSWQINGYTFGGDGYKLKEEYLPDEITDNLIYIGDSEVTSSTLLDADSLGGYLANEYYTASEVDEKIVEVVETVASGKADADHTHSWDSLTDKPFGVLEDGTIKQLDSMYLEPFSIEWDGDTAGLTNINSYMYKISDNVPTYEQISSCTMQIKAYVSGTPVVETNDTLIRQDEVDDTGSVLLTSVSLEGEDSLLYIVYDDVNGYPKGVYFFCGYDINLPVHVSSAQIYIDDKLAYSFPEDKLKKEYLSILESVNALNWDGDIEGLEPNPLISGFYKITSMAPASDFSITGTITVVSSSGTLESIPITSDMVQTNGSYTVIASSIMIFPTNFDVIQKGIYFNENVRTLQIDGYTFGYKIKEEYLPESSSTTEEYATKEYVDEMIGDIESLLAAI